MNGQYTVQCNCYMCLTSEEENLDMLLSLFAESESQNLETPAAGEDTDNLDDLFDEDDDGHQYIEPEEEEGEEDVTPGKSSSAEGGSGLNKSKEDLEGNALVNLGMFIYAQVIHVMIMTAFVFQPN